MAYDILRGLTGRDWSKEALPRGATGYVPNRWWTETEAEAEVQRNMREGGLFGTRLPRKEAEEAALASMKARKIGITSSSGSLLLPTKQQREFFAKIDDVRYDVRRAKTLVSGAVFALSGALALLAISQIFRAASQKP
jgi:hypothetical protein